MVLTASCLPLAVTRLHRWEQRSLAVPLAAAAALLQPESSLMLCSIAAMAVPIDGCSNWAVGARAQQGQQSALVLQPAGLGGHAMLHFPIG